MPISPRLHNEIARAIPSFYSVPLADTQAIRMHLKLKLPHLTLTQIDEVFAERDGWDDVHEAFGDDFQVLPSSAPPVEGARPDPRTAVS